jgi:hypothetical protein
MTDLPTLEAAMKLADQDSPLPSLAGPALKVLRDRIYHLMGQLHGMARVMLERCATEDSATLTALIAELRAREAVGRAKYGTDVDRTDLTNPQWRQHLREELMDALLYSLAEKRTAPMEVVECGGCAPAVAASPVYGVDHGVDDRTVEMLGYHDAGGVLHIEDVVESEPNGPNSGHGHVRPRADGLIAKCGGPTLCRICWNEQTNLECTRMLGELVKLPPVKPGDWLKVAVDEAGEIGVTAIPESELYKCSWCEVCNPALVGVVMVLCPTCVNKRCPHAHDHRDACTHSNAVGQPGSSWEHVKPSAAVSLWRHIDSAPTDGTPVLVKVKPGASLPDRAAAWGGLVFVARNKSDASEWCFAAPAGCGGFLDAWLEGWMPLPAPEDC